VLAAYREREANKAASKIQAPTFKAHALSALDDYLAEVSGSPKLELERCRMCAERKLHLPVMSWLNDENSRIHLFALTFVAKMTDYVYDDDTENQEWSRQVLNHTYHTTAPHTHATCTHI